MNTPGSLFIVATPIGNMQDITLRAIETLRAVDLILAEDTRRTGQLLHFFSISKPMVRFDDFNEAKKSMEIVQKLKDGQTCALVSDAGTPLVSDPGFKLVRECIAQGLKVEAIPGVTAAITALTVSGLPPDKFLFLGFLPHKKSRRQVILSSISLMRADEEGLKATVILYESPHHLIKTLEELKLALGNIEIVISRELTKTYEETFRGTIAEAIQHFAKPKGEFVLLF